MSACPRRGVLGQTVDVDVYAAIGDEECDGEIGGFPMGAVAFTCRRARG